MRGPVLLNLSPREAFVVTCLRRLGEVVVWGQLDCSELVALGQIPVLGVDRRRTHTAHSYMSINPEPVLEPMLGDLAFWGAPSRAVHVAIVAYGGAILSADGATSSITTYDEARRLQHARVRLHPNVDWYRSAPFLGFRRHMELDSLRE